MVDIPNDPCDDCLVRTISKHRQHEALRAKLAEVEKERDEARALLANDRPYPLRDVLTRLAGAARHLLNDHDCDGHGYEEVGAVINEAMTIIHRIDAMKGGA
jgi:hypothetical protein